MLINTNRQTDEAPHNTKSIQTHINFLCRYTSMLEPRVFMALFTAKDIVAVVPFTTAPIVPIRLLTNLLHANTVGKVIIFIIYL